MKLFGFTIFERAERGRSQTAATITMGSAMRAPMPKITPEHMSALRNMERMIRAYDSAMTDSYNSDFKGTYGSANTEILPHRYTVRARGRTLAKDTPHGKAAVRTFQNSVVGPDPFKLEMKVGKYDNTGTFVEEKETNQVIESEWNEFIKKKNFTVRKTMSFMEAMRMVEGNLVAPGSVLCRLHDAYPYNRWGFAVDFLEEDRLQETYVGKSPETGLFGGGNPIRASIEYHPKYNFPLAYWILTRHPGEAFAGANLQPATLTGSSFRTAGTGADVFREQVPAKDIIHFNNLRERPEQDIGMTELDATVMPMWRIHQYEKALTLSSIASAAKPFWLERDVPNGFQVPEALREMMMNTPGLAGNNVVVDAGAGPSDAAAAQEGNGTPQNEVVPAGRETLPPGFKLKQADPKFPIEAAHEFRLDNLRDIAIGAGVSYQDASGDYQNLGFIAGLMCQIPFQTHCKVRQKNLVDGGVDEIFRRWLEAAIMKGALNLDLRRLDEFCRAAHFKGKRPQFVNPLVQAQTLILLNEAGHMSRQQVQDALPDGMSFEKLVHEQANEKKELELHDLSYGDVDATRPEVSKGEPGQTVPTPAATEEGGAADVPPKSKVQSPRHKSARRLVVPMETLLEMSTNGQH